MMNAKLDTVIVKAFCAIAQPIQKLTSRLMSAWPEKVMMKGFHIAPIVGDDSM
jgi:hypothetical protein